MPNCPKCDKPVYFGKSDDSARVSVIINYYIFSKLNKFSSMHYHTEYGKVRLKYNCCVWKIITTLHTSQWWHVKISISWYLRHRWFYLLINCVIIWKYNLFSLLCEHNSERRKKGKSDRCNWFRISLSLPVVSPINDYVINDL